MLPGMCFTPHRNIYLLKIPEGTQIALSSPRAAHLPGISSPDSSRQKIKTRNSFIIF
jgi:hypothetical protein